MSAIHKCGQTILLLLPLCHTKTKLPSLTTQTNGRRSNQIISNHKINHVYAAEAQLVITDFL